MLATLSVAVERRPVAAWASAFTRECSMAHAATCASCPKLDLSSVLH